MYQDLVRQIKDENDKTEIKKKIGKFNAHPSSSHLNIGSITNIVREELVKKLGNSERTHEIVDDIMDGISNL